MFGIGYQEMFIILVVALVIFGPKRLPELAAQAGRWIREFRKMTADLTGEFEKTFAEVDEVRQAVKKELTGMMDEVDDVSKSVGRDLAGPKGSAKATAKTVAPAGKRKNGKAKKLAAGNGKETTALAQTVPLATKADPLADVSLMEDDWVKPVRVAANGATAGNGAASADEALERVRRRRAKAGYARRA
ncbi:MAG TPA: Sec-independent protein translocase protein TatB [Thermomicrobiales bacterium]|jgi:Tat protein translocase TatB subunit|nr:Sec-independent protein translocase protein TatB [Thermomicrobiales bacterium]